MSLFCRHSLLFSVVGPNDQDTADTADDDDELSAADEHRLISNEQICTERANLHLTSKSRPLEDNSPYDHVYRAFKPIHTALVNLAHGVGDPVLVCECHELVRGVQRLPDTGDPVPSPSALPTGGPPPNPNANSGPQSSAQLYLYTPSSQRSSFSSASPPPANPPHILCAHFRSTLPPPYLVPALSAHTSATSQSQAIPRLPFFHSIPRTPTPVNHVPRLPFLLPLLAAFFPFSTHASASPSHSTASYCALAASCQPSYLRSVHLPLLCPFPFILIRYTHRRHRPSSSFPLHRDPIRPARCPDLPPTDTPSVPQPSRLRPVPVPHSLHCHVSLRPLTLYPSRPRAVLSRPARPRPCLTVSYSSRRKCGHPTPAFPHIPTSVPLASVPFSFYLHIAPLVPYILHPTTPLSLSLSHSTRTARCASFAFRFPLRSGFRSHPLHPTPCARPLAYRRVTSYAALPPHTFSALPSVPSPPSSRLLARLFPPLLTPPFCPPAFPHPGLSIRPPFCAYLHMYIAPREASHAVPPAALALALALARPTSRSAFLDVLRAVRFRFRFRSRFRRVTPTRQRKRSNPKSSGSAAGTRAGAAARARGGAHRHARAAFLFIIVTLAASDAAHAFTGTREAAQTRPTWASLDVGLDADGEPLLPELEVGVCEGIGVASEKVGSCRRARASRTSLTRPLLRFLVLEEMRAERHFSVRGTGSSSAPQRSRECW
ncbi:hypothetical protein DFH09DRAFT_1362977 [Mycena vulgaris]|nr:hypothetical protein DFH09DRAFT_1362977 [Mycena vulgaris]